MARTKIFISYSHEDERWRQRIAGHLAVLATEGIVDVWDDRKIGAGEDWLAQINDQMGGARIALLLISSAFLTSKFIRQTEVPKLFDQHEQGGMTIYPLLIRPCPWQEVAWLSRMQVRPAEAKPVATYRGAKVDEVLVQVAREISAIAKSQGTVASPPAVGPAQSTSPPGDISGQWQAEVSYDWPNANYTEIFTFEVDGNEVFGTGSFLESKCALFEGQLSGNKLRFVTKTRTRLGEDVLQETHRYRGKVSADEIKFVMQTEGGFSEHLPVEFTARRRPGA